MEQPGQFIEPMHAAELIEIPVMVLSSSREDFSIRKCYELGVNGYEVKSDEFNELCKVTSNPGFYRMIINQPPQ